MRALFTICILTLSVSITTGQAKVLTSDSDTAFWQSYYQDVLTELGIQPISQLKCDFAFRIYDGRSIIQLEETNSILTATIYLFLKEYKEPPSEINRFHKSHANLSNQTASDIKHLIQDFNIMSIPSDKHIDGWAQNGLDGITYIIEHSTESKMAFKNFWSPNYRTHRELEESRFLRYFISQINDLDEISSANVTFMSKQPFKSYYQFLGSSVAVLKLK